MAKLYAPRSRCNRRTSGSFGSAECDRGQGNVWAVQKEAMTQLVISCSRAASACTPFLLCTHTRQQTAECAATCRALQWAACCAPQPSTNTHDV